MLVLAVLLTASSIIPQLAPQAPQQHSAVRAEPRPDDWWQARQASMNQRVKQGDVGLLFIGDSITQGWEGDGKEVWAKHYAARKAVNLGISGDRTQHVLWRLDHGNVDGIKPRAAVVMIGTNNSNGADNTAAEIADGIGAIVKKLREKLPETKVLVLAIFPRGERPNPQRDKLTEVNRLVARLADQKAVFFRDIGAQFLAADQSLQKEIMPDYLHLSPKGYAIWAEAIEADLAALLGEKRS
ncbi:MAG: platelet-activating factor acetylhydrolase IB subunit [Planctomycetota bacterium]